MGTVVASLLGCALTRKGVTKTGELFLMLSHPLNNLKYKNISKMKPNLMVFIQE